ncbi:hypothetical protein [Anaeromassilibacillus sp. SJQ-1]|uniref:hypothetical protein n=1 Tax=Anaeromassilibacillus sp. SJQ-1 TaxID=3375419 RepID=UPI00398A37E1
MGSHCRGGQTTGPARRDIQVQVRREAYADARALCEELFRLLDSGPEETLIDLTPEEISHCTAGQRAAQAGIRRRIHHILLGIGRWGRN